MIRIGTIEQPNPKLGLVWRATPTTNVRVAAFRALKRDLQTNQTIEPTQVAGFNQFFDDFTGTDARRYGIAIDQKFHKDLYGGLEFSARDLRVPGRTLTANFDERTYRAYLHWTPTERLSSTLTYDLETFSGDKRIRAIVEENTTTHQLEAGVRFFDVSGFFSTVVARYVNQSGVFPSGGVNPISLQNQFVIVDAGLGYRLPKRFGIVGIELRNLLDEHFNFQDLGNRAIEPAVPFIPERTILAHFTLAF